MALILLLCAAVLLYAWLTFFNRDPGFARYILIAAVIVVFVVLVIVGLGFAGIVLSLLSSRSFRLLDSSVNFTVSLLYPMVLWLGQRFRIAQERIQSSFVEVNNQLVRARRGDACRLTACWCFYRTVCSIANAHGALRPLLIIVAAAVVAR